MLICASSWSNTVYESKLKNINPVVYAYPLVEIDMAAATMLKVLFILIPIVTVGCCLIDVIRRKKRDMITK